MPTEFEYVQQVLDAIEAKGFPIKMTSEERRADSTTVEVSVGVEQNNQMLSTTEQAKPIWKPTSPSTTN